MALPPSEDTAGGVSEGEPESGTGPEGAKEPEVSAAAHERISKAMQMRKKFLDYEYEEVLDTRTREPIRVGCAVAVGCPTDSPSTWRSRNGPELQSG